MALSLTSSHHPSACNAKALTLSGGIDDGSASSDPTDNCPPTTAAGGALATARGLNVPLATATANAEFEHGDFWSANGGLVRRAWEEWGREEASSASNLTLSDAMDPDLAAAVRATLESPTSANERAVRSLWTEAVPDGAGGDRHGAYKTRLLTEEGIRLIRSELDRASSAGIPTRRPNGMNRHGFIIDDDVDGAVSLPSLTEFVRGLVEEVGRPVGRMLFPDGVGKGDDIEFYAFTIRYAVGEDVKLEEHRDASVVTVNVNLNLPEEGYGGSSLYLVDGDDPALRHNVRFDPGMAVVHRGSLRHGALPILEGARQNLVIWLFGEGGTVRIAPYAEDEQLTVEERWSRRDREARTKEELPVATGWKKFLGL